MHNSDSASYHVSRAHYQFFPICILQQVIKLFVRVIGINNNNNNNNSNNNNNNNNSLFQAFSSCFKTKLQAGAYI